MACVQRNFSKFIVISGIEAQLHALEGDSVNMSQWTDEFIFFSSVCV